MQNETLLVRRDFYFFEFRRVSNARKEGETNDKAASEQTVD
jgi:hypothetical protein